MASGVLAAPVQWRKDKVLQTFCFLIQAKFGKHPCSRLTHCEAIFLRAALPERAKRMLLVLTENEFAPPTHPQRKRQPSLAETAPFIHVY